jgi:hypothetical protein
MDVKVIRVGFSDGRRERREAHRARLEREAADATHAQNLKLNAALKRSGAPGRWECGPKCPVCHPIIPTQDANSGLSTLDLRGGAAGRPKVVLSGKRGKCRRCGQRCPKACWYCSDACRYDLAKRPPPRYCQCGCRQPLPDGAPDAKRYLDPAHQKRAYRARHGR